ncbi:acyltransferase family protein [Paracoccus beibuensis]|uniref:acyltransferase family protein n=1 Tax=Paracoccus beibuensis TaxID=547602 RepID=UPI00223FB436|nr:acyltransferase family protein [Paracoccus beibuensis]
MDNNFSDAIRISRVFCILFMSYVHLHILEPAGAEHDALTEIVSDTLGRSSVPLLSVISGYLMVSFFSRRSYLDALGKRFRSLIVPMIIWNGIAIALWGGSGINDLLALTGSSKLIYLTFLRDIFVMSALTPLLLGAARRSPLLLMGAITTIYLADLKTVLILRPQIVFFYTAGVLLHVCPIPLRRNWAGPAIAALALISVASAVWPTMNDSHYFDALIKRPAASLGFWALAMVSGRHLPALARLDRHAFPFFLSHGVLFHILGALYHRAEVLHFPAAYLILWLSAPWICFLVAAATSCALERARLAVAGSGPGLNLAALAKSRRRTGRL